jgi:hypothetical protein
MFFGEQDTNDFCSRVYRLFITVMKFIDSLLWVMGYGLWVMGYGFADDA